MKTEPIRILYTDDDPDDFALLQEGLQQVVPNHSLHFVNDSRNFIAAARDFKPHLIFLDYNMPICDGKECLEQLKEDPLLKDIPVIMYCTSSSAYTLSECFQLGAVRFLLKPVNYALIFKGLHMVFDLLYDGRLIRTSEEDFFIDTYKLN